MGYKIFVSYKYKDDSVFPISNYNNMISYYSGESTVRDYVDKLESYFDHTNNIYKGESDNDDLSCFSEETIWEKLKTRIFDSSVTIVMVSPHMKERNRSERSQWIPWEIAYSLRETTRGDRTSHSNAILAVILPDKRHQYNYFTEPFSYQDVDGSFHVGDDCVFPIIRNNMNNFQRYDNSFFSSHGVYSISTNESSYIPSVTWDDFIKQPMSFINCAVNRMKNIQDYKIQSTINYDFRWSING